MCLQDRTVIKGSVARKLLKMGFKIKDVKPQKQEDGSIDYTRCVFVFEGKTGLDDAIYRLLER